jgi:hypothetical protein
MVCGPTLEDHLLALLKANLAIDHVCGGVVSSVAITDPALRACIVPKLNFSLFGDQFHRLYLLGCPAIGTELERSLYGIPSESAKQDLDSSGHVH